MPETESNTDRASVMTYVSPAQKQEWVTHAETLNMSQSEFVRTMVQAGRRDFTVPDRSSITTETASRNTDSTNTQTNSLRARVIDALTADTYHEWDELLAIVSENIEQRLDQTLAELQEASIITYSGRHGGYTLREDADVIDNADTENLSGGENS
ncbi:MAG: hypothetical protein J07HQW1_02521 [Haloquadratum walsbyi J07HQW1]|jgi:hypothetical protein|uniref:Uncharacterized protein n=1 Tax=Haloquadratum walsbyi J07HQW1 TaxID=1238424 RepID=U1PFT0_9EURY|nr:MAG: hypothetical protein J07HQW1_02521 [Haloquadratum walsbyi J07HQW1]